MGINTNDLTPDQARALLSARANRPTALSLFRPTESQEQLFKWMERDDIIEILVSGSNRAGKSLCAAAAFASIILNEPIIFRDGSKHNMRPARWQNEALKVWIVGYDWKHIGKTMHRLLFQNGLFKVIRDQVTGKWRAWDPTRPGESEQMALTRPSPALITMRDIVGGEDGMVWENKKGNQVASCELKHDGTKLEFFASTGARPQGDPVHAIWIDEHIEDGKWFNELKVRLLDYRGRLMWTAWADTEPSDEMSGLAERAKSQDGLSGQTSYAVTLKGRDNPYTTGKHRDAVFAAMDDDEQLARDEGIMNAGRWRVYARFDKYTHCALRREADADDALAKAIREHNCIPPDWTRYLILDPGTINPAVLFVAIPPPQFGDFVVPYDELYLHYVSAKPLAEAIAAKTKGQLFEDFIIDSHAARQTPMGFDGTIGMNYEKEFAAARLRCRRHGSRFSFGSDQVHTRIMRTQGSMNLRLDGKPRLRLFGCPILTKQLENYRWARDPKGNPTDEPAKTQKVDVAQCLEYFLSRDDCGYYRPSLPVEDDPRSLESVNKSILKIFGKTSDKKTPERSVFCGAGTVPLTLR